MTKETDDLTKDNNVSEIQTVAAVKHQNSQQREPNLKIGFALISAS